MHSFTCFIVIKFSSSFDTLGPTQQALPDLLVSTSHQNPDATSRTALQVAFDTQLPPFQWFPTQPERFAHFQQLMTVQRNASTWLSVFPLASELQDWNATAAADQALFVDVGGGFGQQCEAFKTATAAAGLASKGRIILQDLPATLERAPALERVEFQAHDFFTEQPVKGTSHSLPSPLKRTISASAAISLAIPIAHPHLHTPFPSPAFYLRCLSFPSNTPTHSRKILLSPQHPPRLPRHLSH